MRAVFYINTLYKIKEMTSNHVKVYKLKYLEVKNMPQIIKPEELWLWFNASCPSLNRDFTSPWKLHPLLQYLDGLQIPATLFWWFSVYLQRWPGLYRQSWP